MEGVSIKTKVVKMFVRNTRYQTISQHYERLFTFEEQNRSVYKVRKKKYRESTEGMFLKGVGV